tara:strand:- start:186 stop:341 length:156 start_codon:yes stop_codon:yes gene_type:complete
MKYKVYNKNGEDNDAIMKFEAVNLDRAIEYASQIKRLSLKKFLKLFIVKEA